MAESRLLGTSGLIVRLLIVLNLLSGLFVLGMLAASYVFGESLLAGLGFRPPYSADLFGRLRLVMLIGLVSVPLAHVILSRLLAIVESARAGDPFVAGNAARLAAMAWALLALEVLHVAVGVLNAMAGEGQRFAWSFSLTGLLAVLLLFVLARVFDEGARMRDELEGTV